MKVKLISSESFAKEITDNDSDVLLTSYKENIVMSKGNYIFMISNGG